MKVSARISEGRARLLAMSQAIELNAAVALIPVANVAFAMRDVLTGQYSLGMVLFEMVTGEPPQGAEVPSDLRDDLPDWVDRVFSRCYTRRERRYANAAEVVASDTGDPDSTPNDGSGDDYVTSSTTPQQADVSLVKSALPTSGNPGDTV